MLEILSAGVEALQYEGVEEGSIQSHVMHVQQAGPIPINESCRQFAEFGQLRNDAMLHAKAFFSHGRARVNIHRSL